VTANLNIDPQKWALPLSGLLVVVILIYAVVLISTLMKIWSAEFRDPREKMFWFLLVLILSPIAMPVYLLMSEGRAKKGDAAGDTGDRPGQRPADARYSQTGMSDDNRERELARLLEMKKNGILSREQFNKAKKRLQQDRE
jgi:hypothetical protein